jgi:hypothetical protein
MTKRRNSKNGSMNSGDLREVLVTIDSARKRLRNSPNTSYTVGLDLIRAASKLNMIINTSKK